MTVINTPPKENTPGKQEPNTKNENPTKNSEDYSNWGYDMYPDRSRNDKQLSVTDYMFGKGREPFQKIRCERNIYRCVKTSPLVKLMMGALRASGCPVDVRRHFACENCADGVSGGYDPILNQVIICHNNVKKLGLLQSVLTHELIHMFDYCKNELNFKNIDHLACTEIRAANLAHCSFLSAVTTGDASPFNIKQAHQNCVKSRALASVLAVRKVTNEEAVDAIERVFSRCYADLEPIGRRLRRNSEDIDRAYAEGYYYGYDQP